MLHHPIFCFSNAWFKKQNVAVKEVRPHIFNGTWYCAIQYQHDAFLSLNVTISSACKDEQMSNDYEDDEMDSAIVAERKLNKSNDFLHM